MTKAGKVTDSNRIVTPIDQDNLPLLNIYSFLGKKMKSRD